MGNTSSMLTQYDIEEVQEHCNHTFSQQEIVSLYQRFCQLDRNGGGFIFAEEFMSVPEFAVNPLSQRLLRMLEGLNFKEFVAFLSAFSSRASLQQKVEFIFKVYDSDGNGKVAFNAMLDVLRDLTGQFISEQQREQVLTQVLEEAGYTKGSLLAVSDFMKVLGNSGLKMEVELFSQLGFALRIILELVCTLAELVLVTSTSFKCAMAESSMSLGISETEITALKDALCAQQQLLQKLYNELDVEREASATAASEALSMILRLQGEKAAVKMEASQYKRIAEEKMCHAEEALAIFEDLIYQKEMEIASLDYQVQAYRHKLLSLGVSNLGIGETKFPENLLQRNESLVWDMGLQSTARRNSMPPISLKFSNHKKGIIERERSASPDLVLKVVEENTNQELNIQGLDMEKKTENSAVGDINSYWEQIRKLDERVRGIVDLKGTKSANLSGGSRPSSLLSQVSTSMLFDPTKGVITTKLGEAKHPENLLENEVTTDSACSSSVHDVFEVPQNHVSGKGCGQQTKEQKRLNLEDDGWLGKPDSVSQEAVKPYVKDETDSLIRTSEIIEVERQVVRRESTNRGEEEIKLLKEIQEQLNSIESQIRSWTTKKSSPPDELRLVYLTEAMLYFWL
ncbi:hypothetical protein F0562_009262 [Nyssa sinensis]|uniref:EF-hand domain-containing protein n=1 Tax=Nyssa sinensis TaxID=561372 RepID=A0A5J4ZXN8_9ASTE|nr:hypothetical protein F0562_009262 [Nyssa sinensis]